MNSSAFLENYSFRLPPELIASAPAVPRDSSRLLIHDAKTGRVSDAVFRDLADILPKGSLLVMNETKVMPARIVLSKQSGGKAEILFYTNLWDKASARITGISDRKIVPGQKLLLGEKEICAVKSQDENLFSFELSVSPSEFIAVLEQHGVMPIPKYIKETPLSQHELRERYQTIFAKNQGSVAAPTASLHFTPRLFKKLQAAGIEIAYLSLHVGAGTFAPLTDKEFSESKLHEEVFTIPRETLEKIAEAKRAGRAVIPVGTTALRALESVGIIERPASDISSRTQIFIRKPHAFRVADGLITNFHVPRSSLMCLVDAFLDFKNSPKGILDLYDHAIEKKYRFFSFGDAMLIV